MPDRKLHMSQAETAEWLGTTIEDMNEKHDDIHRILADTFGIESQSLRVANGEELNPEEQKLSWYEEDAVLYVQRGLALGASFGRL